MLINRPHRARLWPGTRLLHLLAGCALLACGPTHAVSRNEGAVVDDAGGLGGITGTPSGGISGTGGGTGGNLGMGGSGGASGGAGGVVGTGGNPATGGSPAAGGSGGMGTGGMGTGGTTEPDALVDEPVAPPPDLVLARKALVVVGNPSTPTAGDAKIKTSLEARGFTVTLGDDGGTSSAATGMDLVVIANSSVSATVAAKFKDVTIPVLSMEASIFDDMKMTGPISKTDYDEEDDRRITILAMQAAHPLAAGFTGTVTVNQGGTSPCCGINWGKPADSAITVASYSGMVNTKIALYGYEKGAAMVDAFVAPARRVGFFAADTTMEHLTSDGLKLLNAAISWAAP